MHAISEGYSRRVQEKKEIKAVENLEKAEAEAKSCFADVKNAEIRTKIFEQS